MSQPPKSAAIIAGAGLGHRLGERAFTSLSRVVDEIIITAPQGFEEQFRALVGESAKVITGGILRSDSVRLALASLSPSIEYVLIHDAARGLASSDLAARVLSELHSGSQAVVPVLEMVDTVKEVDAQGFVTNTPD
ncbi:MAG: bifunctional 2-C-methyl-D-erythritol 4-phosphate cytidylyltransferase/2-C-methyl-D-erythritol 2,4-cyclodiphosphate synthase, partial [Actinobacteria bacterium]|nr:bifunctional 2-C-methyl-D-erythritol 4-phosphate cytidylyltransferase/2-C-methyl-D-erythritol 2,4-cyclodiphosphate synthase [Actinomycetota bacterium]